MKTKKLSFSIVFPAYNEEENIKESIKSALKIGRVISDKFEIIVVNDGSGDKTSEIARNLTKKHKEIKIIDQNNQGYGGAVWTGIKNAHNDLIFFTDSDLQFNLQELKKFIPYLKSYDVVFGYRKPRKDPFMRLVNAWGWKFLNRIFLGIKVRDIDCAFKLFDGRVFKKVNKIQSHGAMFSAEMIYKIKKAGFRIKELPVTHYPRVAGSPTGANFNVIKKALREFWQVYKRR